MPTKAYDCRHPTRRRVHHHHPTHFVKGVTSSQPVDSSSCPFSEAKSICASTTSYSCYIGRRQRPPPTSKPAVHPLEFAKLNRTKWVICTIPASKLKVQEAFPRSAPLHCQRCQSSLTQCLGWPCCVHRHRTIPNKKYLISTKPLRFDLQQYLGNRATVMRSKLGRLTSCQVICWQCGSATVR